MRTGAIGSLHVSVVGLGCNNFGRALDAAAAERVVHASLDAGITHFDTSSNYGEGRSESYLGAALGGRRPEVVIASKFGMPVAGWPDSGGARPEYVRRVIERSLTQLGTDYVDLYMLHRPDPTTPITDTLGAMHDLVEEGKVREIGCSNLDADQLAEALSLSSKLDLATFVANQVEYSLVHRDPETNGLLELCAGRGVALLPFYPLANGLLTGKTRRGQQPQGRLTMDRYQGYLTDENFDVAEGLEAFARDRRLTMVAVALGWLLAHDVVQSVTPGATSAEQVVSNATAAEWEPSIEDLEALESILR